MSKNKRIRIKELIPPWEMPSDPVKGLLWFMHWLLKVAVHFFWLPILIMIIYETYQNWNISGAFNGAVGGVITLLVGVGIWGLLYLVSLLVTISANISRTIAEVTRMQQNIPSQRNFFTFEGPEDEEHVVEGTITDLEEERRKRRRE